MAQSQPDIPKLLNDTLNPDSTIRTQASDLLLKLGNDSTGPFSVALANVLADQRHDMAARRAAGIMLKNLLAARDHKTKAAYIHRWQSIDNETRNQVKELGLNTLYDPNAAARNASASAVAEIAAAELSVGLWDSFIQDMNARLNSTSDPGAKHAIYETLGYLFEALEVDVLEKHSDIILTALVQGARQEEENADVRRSALSSLSKALPFVKTNFDREGERNYIMQVICEATQAPDVGIQVVAFECLVRAVSLYYSYMPHYMDQALFGLTITGMKSSNERVAIQALDFWTTVCEEEIDIKAEEEEASELENTPIRKSYHFARLAIQEIAPTLLNLLVRPQLPEEEFEEDNVDPDEWTVATAAGTCLTVLAQNVGDPLIFFVRPFVETNIVSTNWREREAALMAFGSALDGPEQSVLSHLVKNALPVFVEKLNDPSVSVKDTAAWVIARIADIVLDTIDIETQFPPMIQQLISSLSDDARVAHNVAWAIINLTEQLSSADVDTSPLSPYYQPIVENLLLLADRTNHSEGQSIHVRTSAYEALSTLAAQAPGDVVSAPVYAGLTESILERATRLATVRNESANFDDLQNYDDLMINFCSVLSSIIRRVGQQIQPLADRIMTFLLGLLSNSSKHLTILEDVFHCVGAMITSLEQNFEPYLSAFLPFLQSALQSTEDYNLCSTAVGIVGDLTRSLSTEQFMMHASMFMQLLLANVQSAEVHRDVKPPILSTIGDIAFVIGAHSGPEFLETVFSLLSQASSMKPDLNDFDMVEYVVTLREAVLEAYLGVVGGQKPVNNGQALLPYVASILEFLQLCFFDQDSSESMIKNSVTLLGDLAELFPNGEIKELLKAEWIAQAIKIARSRPGNDQRANEIKELARFAKARVKKATE